MNVNLTPNGAKPACCPYCRLPIRCGSRCSECETLYHDDCAELLWRCALLGCPGHFPVEVPLMRGPLPTRRAPKRPTLRVRWSRAGVVLSAAVGALTAAALLTPIPSLPASPVFPTESVRAPGAKIGADPIARGTGGTRQDYVFTSESAPTSRPAYPGCKECGMSGTYPPCTANQAQGPGLEFAPQTASDREFDWNQTGIVTCTTVTTSDETPSTQAPLGR